MTSTDRLLGSAIGALTWLNARENGMKAELGVVIVSVAFATTRQVMMATTVARTMAPHREDFWIRVIMVFILWWVSFWLRFVVVLFRFVSSRLHQTDPSTDSVGCRETLPVRVSRYRIASPIAPLSVRRAEISCVRRCLAMISTKRISCPPAASLGGITNALFEILRCGRIS